MTTRWNRAAIKNLTENIDDLTALQESCVKYQKWQEGSVISSKWFHILVSVNNIINALPGLIKEKKKILTKIRRRK